MPRNDKSLWPVEFDRVPPKIVDNSPSSMAVTGMSPLQCHLAVPSVARGSASTYARLRLPPGGLGDVESGRVCWNIHA